MQDFVHQPYEELSHSGMLRFLGPREAIEEPPRQFMVPRVPLKGSLKGFYKGSIRVLYYSEPQKVGTWL